MSNGLFYPNEIFAVQYGNGIVGAHDGSLQTSTLHKKYLSEDVVQAMVGAALEKLADDLERRSHKTTAAMARSFTPDEARAALERLLEEARREGVAQAREGCARHVEQRLEQVKTLAPEAARAVFESVPDAIRARGKTS